MTLFGKPSFGRPAGTLTRLHCRLLGHRWEACYENCCEGETEWCARCSGGPRHAYEKPRVCPKCNGQGRVSTPPWVAGDQPTYAANDTASHTCRVCGGAGTTLATAAKDAA